MSGSSDSSLDDILPFPLPSTQTISNPSRPARAVATKKVCDLDPYEYTFRNVALSVLGILHDMFQVALSLSTTGCYVLLLLQFFNNEMRTVFWIIVGTLAVTNGILAFSFNNEIFSKRDTLLLLPVTCCVGPLLPLARYFQKLYKFHTAITKEEKFSGVWSLLSIGIKDNKRSRLAGWIGEYDYALRIRTDLFGGFWYQSLLETIPLLVIQLAVIIIYQQYTTLQLVSLCVCISSIILKPSHWWLSFVWAGAAGKFLVVFYDVTSAVFVWSVIVGVPRYVSETEIFDVPLLYNNNTSSTTLFDYDSIPMLCKVWLWTKFIFSIVWTICATWWRFYDLWFLEKALRPEPLIWGSRLWVCLLWILNFGLFVIVVAPCAAVHDVMKLSWIVQFTFRSGFPIVRDFKVVRQLHDFLHSSTGVQNIPNLYYFLRDHRDHLDVQQNHPSGDGFKHLWQANEVLVKASRMKKNVRNKNPSGVNDLSGDDTADDQQPEHGNEHSQPESSLVPKGTTTSYRIREALRSCEAIDEEMYLENEIISNSTDIHVENNKIPKFVSDNFQNRLMHVLFATFVFLRNPLAEEKRIFFDLNNNNNNNGIDDAERKKLEKDKNEYLVQFKLNRAKRETEPFTDTTDWFAYRSRWTLGDADMNFNVFTSTTTQNFKLYDGKPTVYHLLLGPGSNFMSSWSYIWDQFDKADRNLIYYPKPAILLIAVSTSFISIIFNMIFPFIYAGMYWNSFQLLQKIFWYSSTISLFIFVVFVAKPFHDFLITNLVWLFDFDDEGSRRWMFNNPRRWYVPWFSYSGSPAEEIMSNYFSYPLSVVQVLCNFRDSSKFSFVNESTSNNEEEEDQELKSDSGRKDPTTVVTMMKSTSAIPENCFSKHVLSFLTPKLIEISEMSPDNFAKIGEELKNKLP